MPKNFELFQIGLLWLCLSAHETGLSFVLGLACGLAGLGLAFVPRSR